MIKIKQLFPQGREAAAACVSMREQQQAGWCTASGVVQLVLGGGDAVSTGGKGHMRVVLQPPASTTCTTHSPVFSSRSATTPPMTISASTMAVFMSYLGSYRGRHGQRNGVPICCFEQIYVCTGRGGLLCALVGTAAWCTAACARARALANEGWMAGGR